MESVGGNLALRTRKMDFYKEYDSHGGILTKFRGKRSSLDC